MKEKIRTYLFILIIFGLSIGNLLTPTRYFSKKEGRYLETFPKISYEDIMSSKFGKKFESYTTDQFLGRNLWISTKTLSDLAMLKKDNGRVYFGKDDYLFDKDGPIDEEQFRKNMANINILLDNIKGLEGMDINILLTPTKSEVLKDKLPYLAPVVNERELVERIKTSIKSNPNISIFDLIGDLAGKSREDIYYRTDHHWTSRGAFYAYHYYLNQIREKPLGEDDFIISKVNDEFLGTAYRKSNLYFGSPDPIYKYTPKKELKYSLIINRQEEKNKIYDESFLADTDKYSYFLGGDKALIEIGTSIENGKSIVVFKDSFANSFIPFLMNHYESITVVDTRYYNMSISELIKEKSPEQVLLLYNIQNFAQEKSFSVFNR